jgi:hypothetical protein
LKGTTTITTSTPDLFSHPYEYRWDGENASDPAHQVSRENLFSERADTSPSIPAQRPTQPPRNPFEETAKD